MELEKSGKPGKSDEGQVVELLRVDLGEGHGAESTADGKTPPTVASQSASRTLPASPG